jgi:shikimate kinase
MKIYLIGMPGSGKTTLGKQLADEMSLPFIDLDDEIQKREQLTIPEIFITKGEDHFRQIESSLLVEHATLPTDFVMATGGGAPCFYKGIEIINNSGLSIFLDVAVDELLNRLKANHDRPLLGKDLQEKETRLRQLHSTRLVIYNQAKIKITNPDIQKVLQAIRLKP